MNKLSCKTSAQKSRKFAAVLSGGLLSFMFVSSAMSNDGVLIGAPNTYVDRPEGSEVVLVNFKALQCFYSKKEAEKALQKIVPLFKHSACGEGFAHLLMSRKESMSSGEHKKFNESIQIPYILNQPEVFVDKGNFKVKPVMKTHQAEKKGEVIISLSRIIQDHVKATVSASFEDVKMDEYTAHYEGEQTFVNQVPVKRNRIMTDSKTLKLGESKILSGHMWVEGLEKKEGVLPEHSRVWLELSVK